MTELMQGATVIVYYEQSGDCRKLKEIIVLAGRGHEVHFISYVVPVRITEASERIHFHEVEVMNYPLFDHPPYALALATQMYNVAASEPLDLLHVHYAIPHSVSAYLARAMLRPRRVPFVTTLHGT